MQLHARKSVSSVRSVSHRKRHRQGSSRIAANRDQQQTDTARKAPATAPTPNRIPPPKLPAGQTRPFAQVALEQAVDTVTDVWRHATRQLAPLPSEVAALDKLVTGGDGQVVKVKPTLLLLGSGWGAHSLLKVIDTDVYDVCLVSPRNHFLFTPMLPSTAVGTVEFRSLLEPIRTSNPFASFFEASCDAIDLERKVVTCTSAFAYDGGARPRFQAVGEVPATFGVPGVRENCFFMKEVTDTVALRNRIGECFELAALPGTSLEDRQRLLSFVVVGGGPTGVEFAGTLSDFLRLDLKRKYPGLMKYVNVTLLQSAQSILTQFDGRLAQRALDNLTRTGVTVRTGVRVVEVTRSEVVLQGGERLRHGVCVWSTGNAANPLVQQLVEHVPAQATANAGKPAVGRKLLVDSFLRVVGARDVLALGDCASVCTGPLPATAQVAGQQGAYLAHMINRGYAIGVGGEDQPPPCRPQAVGPLGWTLPELLQDLQARELALAAYPDLPGAPRRTTLLPQLTTTSSSSPTPPSAPDSTASSRGGSTSGNGKAGDGGSLNGSHTLHGTNGNGGPHPPPPSRPAAGPDWAAGGQVATPSPQPSHLPATIPAPAAPPLQLSTTSREGGLGGKGGARLAEGLGQPAVSRGAVSGPAADSLGGATAQVAVLQPAPASPAGHLSHSAVEAGQQLAQGRGPEGRREGGSGEVEVEVEGAGVMQGWQGQQEGGQLAFYPRPFEFLSLGIMAYVGDNKALTQIEAGGDASLSLKLYGGLAFLLWRSVYITKQVSFRNRVLILFDWIKTRVFGRDTSLF